MRYVHLSCLTQWRFASANPNSFYECDNCKYRYNLTRCLARLARGREGGYGRAQ